MVTSSVAGDIVIKCERLEAKTSDYKSVGF